ncbi:MAG TPA: anthranilate synthase component I [Chloroflexota bacterium]
MSNDYTPTLEECRRIGVTEYPVAVSREVFADLDTPVSAYLKVREAGPSFLLESVEGGQSLGRYSFIGSRPRRVLRVAEGMQRFDNDPPQPCADPLQAIRTMVDAYGPAPTPDARFEGGAVGYLSYEAARWFERIPLAAEDPLSLPDAVFLDIDTVLIFDHVRRKIRIVSHAWPSDSIERSYACAVDRIDEIAQRLEQPVDAPPLPAPVLLKPGSNLKPSEFEDMVTAGKKHIRAGNILQVVLSQRLSMPLEGDPFGLYRRLRTVSPSPYMYYLDLGDHQLVGASPELLIQVEGGVVSSRPIAGTRRRGRNREEDATLAEDLVADEKERAEHLMLVDLARNDVGRVSAAGSVEVSNFMGVEQFSHVMHMVSDVTGRLAPGRSPYDALRAAFPAGTVSGAPKIRAMQIISELERDQRGSYAGAAGFISKGGNMETAITIRTGLIKNGVLHVQAGAGIVADSVPEREYVESMNKARAMLEAAGGAS